MLRVLSILALAAGLLAAPSALAVYQQSDEAVPPATAPQPLSVMLRDAGFQITNDEAAYLDADAQLTDQFVAPILTVELHAQYVNDDFSRQVTLAQLRQVTTLDPNGNAVPAPASLAEMQRLAVARRTAIRQAAGQWLAALQANDPNWVTAGAAAMGTAGQGEVEWYDALRRRLSGQAVPAR